MLALGAGHNLIAEEAACNVTNNNNTPARAVLRPLVHSRLLDGCRGLVSNSHGLGHHDLRPAHACRPRCNKPEINGSIARLAIHI